MIYYLFGGLVLLAIAAVTAFTIIILTKTKHKARNKSYWTYTSTESDSNETEEVETESEQDNELDAFEKALQKLRETLSNENIRYQFPMATGHENIIIGNKNKVTGYTFAQGEKSYSTHSPQYLRKHLNEWFHTLIEYYVDEYDDLELVDEGAQKGEVAYIKNHDCFYIYDGEDWQLYDDDSWEDLYEEIFYNK